MTYDQELFRLALDFANSPGLPSLKKRFKGFTACNDHATAAAFGYLAAIKDAEDAEVAEEAEETEEPNVLESICESLTAFADKDHFLSANKEEVAKMIFLIVFDWLLTEIEDSGCTAFNRGFLVERFAPFLPE